MSIHHIFIKTVAACLILCTSISGTAWGTSIVLYKVGDRVFVAADSKFITGDNRPAGYGCKVIELQRNVFFAHARVLVVPGTNIDVAGFAKQAFSRPGTMIEKITEFERTAYPALAGAMEALQRGDPAAFKRDYENKTVTEALFFGVDPQTGHSFVSFRYSIAKWIGTRIAVVQYAEECPGDGCPAGVYHREIGEYDCIEEFLRTNPNYFIVNRHHLQMAVRKLVVMEMKDKPGDVGGEITEIAIDQAGPGPWKKRGACRDQERELTRPVLADPPLHQHN
jgi:hypothetical protein